MPLGDGKDGSTRAPSGALLSYQTRLLESPSLSRASSLSRSNSQTAGILAPNGTRRWNPSHPTHRSTVSIDTVRDRAKRSSVEGESEVSHLSPIRVESINVNSSRERTNSSYPKFTPFIRPSGL